MLLALPLLAGCDFLESATARVVVAGLVVKSPDLRVAGQLDVEGEVFAETWAGRRAGETSTEEPDPIEGAAVSLGWNDATVKLTAQEPGLYATDSTRSDLRFEPATYAFVVNLPGDPEVEYGGAVTAPTALSAAAVRLDPQPTESVPGFPEVQKHPRSTALDVSWGAQFGKYGYVTVFRANRNDPKNPELVFENRPRTALELLQLVAGDPPTRITVPADAFAQDGLYAVVLVAMERGDVLPSTFLGSPQLAGSGAARFLFVGDAGL